MLKIQNKFSYTCSENDTKNTAAIIVCGGSSSRMNGVDKIFAEINSKEVVAHSIYAFEKCKDICQIIIVTKNESILKMQQLCDKYNFKKVTDIVSGGNCRQQSVANGLNVLDNNCNYVLIHDGARPFVSSELIQRVIDETYKYNAVTCAIKLKDTVKAIRSDGLVISTPDRSQLVAVQTPQGFETSMYKNCVNAKINELNLFTDDCSIVEACGYSVYIVDGDNSNIKITTPEDILFAEALIKGVENK